MKNILEVSELNGQRFELALEQLANGLGFVFDEVWFRRDGNVLWCEAISPYWEVEHTDAGLRELIDHARSRFEVLRTSSEVFKMLVSVFEVKFSVIADHGTGTAKIIDSESL